MTDPNDLTHFVAAISGTSASWIERVKAADADAEAAWEAIHGAMADKTARALIAIAAELRAQRIARRPGTGQ